MVFLEESFALVFLVAFELGGVGWVVRVKCDQNAGKDNLEVVNAKNTENEELSGHQWEDLAAAADRLEEFWAEAIYQYIILQGGDVGEA